MDYEEFYKNYLPKRCLPSDYGGTLETAHELHVENTKKLETMTDFFRAEELQRYN